MNESQTIDRAMQAQLDRLVAGELPESERRSLLAWLDEDISRWRACAVAFLEAQTWEAAASGWPLEKATAAVCAEQTPVLHSARSKRQSGFVGLLALSAALAAAFLVGALLGRQWPAGENRSGPIVVEQPEKIPGKSPNPESRGAVLATVAVRSNLQPGVPLQLKLPVTTADHSVDAGAVAISDYERSQWEKHGFEVVEEQRYLPASLPDGRRVVVPVKQVRLKLKAMPVS